MEYLLTTVGYMTIVTSPQGTTCSWHPYNDQPHRIEIMTDHVEHIRGTAMSDGAWLLKAPAQVLTVRIDDALVVPVRDGNG
jgi:hypothetical protein